MNAALSIPKLKDTPAILWREQFIMRYYPDDDCIKTIAESLSLSIQYIKRTGFTQEEVEFHDESCTDLLEHYSLDEVDLAVLTAISILTNIDHLADTSKDEVYSIVNAAYGKQITNFDQIQDYELKAKEFLKTSLKKYNDLLLPKIRSKIALIEMFAALGTESAMFYLINLNPNYVTSEILGNWIAFNRWNYHYSKDEVIKQAAAKKLDLFCKTIKGDKRKNKSRDHSYWYINRRYDLLLEVITKIRKLKTNLDNEKLNLLFEFYDIPDRFINFIEKKFDAPSSLAADILVAEKLITSSEAFADIQTAVNKLTKKHGDTIMKDDLLCAFLDYPTKHPELIAQTDIWKAFESLIIEQ